MARSKRRPTRFNSGLLAPTEPPFASPLSRDRQPTMVELMTQVYGNPNGITAARIADAIHAKVGNVIDGLRHLQAEGYVTCQDDPPTAWSVWTKVDTNPKRVVSI